MIGIIKYKLALLNGDKRYLLTAFIFFIVLLSIIVFCLTFRTYYKMEGDLDASIADYSNLLSQIETAYKIGNINEEQYRTQSAVYRYLIEQNKAKWMYFDSSLNLEGHKVASSFYFASVALFPITSAIFGSIVGTFSFSLDFSSKRIKNIFSSNKERKDLFKGTMFLAFTFDLVFSLFLFLLFLCFTIPLHGLHILRQINDSVFENNVIEVVLVSFLVCLVLSILFTVISSLLGILFKDNSISSFLPIAVAIILTILPIAIAKDNQYGKEVIFSFIPIGSLTTLLIYGTSVYLWIALLVHFVLELLLLLTCRRIYEKTDI